MFLKSGNSSKKFFKKPQKKFGKRKGYYDCVSYVIFVVYWVIRYEKLQINFEFPTFGEIYVDFFLQFEICTNFFLRNKVLFLHGDFCGEFFILFLKLLNA